MEKKAPKSLNAVKNDRATFDRMLTGDADIAGELLTLIQEQKEQTNLHGEEALDAVERILDGHHPWDLPVPDVYSGRLWEKILGDDTEEFQKWQQEARARFIADSLIRTAHGKQAPNSLNAVMKDPATLETMLTGDADIAGDADTAGELQTKIQEQKEQTNLDGESE